MNGDDAAAAIAGALQADELLLLADVPGVLDAIGAIIPDHRHRTPRDELIASGVAKGGMSAKLQAARSALAGGVAASGSVIRTALLDPSAGTRLSNAHSHT